MVSGEGRVTLDTELITLKPEEAVDIPTGTMHRMWQRPWSWHSDGLRGLLRCSLPLPGMTVDKARYRWPLPKLRDRCQHKES